MASSSKKPFSKKCLDEGERVSYSTEGLWATYWPRTGLVIVSWLFEKAPVKDSREARTKAMALTKKLGWPDWKERQNEKRQISKADGTSIEMCVVTGSTTRS